MKEERYFYAPDAAGTNLLPDDEAMHAVRVLRLQPGDIVYLMDGRGKFYRAEITLATKKTCAYSILGVVCDEPARTSRIHLAIAPTKNIDRIEWLAEKATEIGIASLTFLKCRFSERTKLRAERIEKIVVSAAKQSRKAWMPAVSDMTDFSSFIHAERSGLKYICHCYDSLEKADLFADLCSTLSSARHPDVPASDITVLIGPEGDFSIGEVNDAIACGYRSATLGESRLRTETAGLMAVATSDIALRSYSIGISG